MTKNMNKNLVQIFDENNNEEEIEEYSLDKKKIIIKNKIKMKPIMKLQMKKKIEDTENINEETKKKD